MSDPLTVAIVGCGRIAGGWNRDAADEAILTHALAYRRHPGFRLAACVDLDLKTSTDFARRWSVPASYCSLDECLEAQRPSVVSVCVTTPAHGSVLERLLDSSVRAVFCEKPISGNLDEAKQLVDAYREAGKLLAVNYTRRWDPAMAALRFELTRGDWGAIRAIVVWYVRGVVNNGSHAIDLLHWLLGPMEIAVVTGSRMDGITDDPSIDAVLRLADGTSVHLVAGDGRDFALFEIQILAERGMISIEDAGMTIRRRGVDDDPVFAGNRRLAPGEWRKTDYPRALWHAVDNLYRAVTGNAELDSSGESALAALTLCKALSDWAMPVPRNGVAS